MTEVDGTAGAAADGNDLPGVSATVGGHNNNARQGDAAGQGTRASATTTVGEGTPLRRQQRQKQVRADADGQGKRTGTMTMAGKEMLMGMGRKPARWQTTTALLRHNC